MNQSKALLVFVIIFPSQKNFEEMEDLMISTLTMEELIGLKLECSSRLTRGRLYGFNLWHNTVDIIKEALYNATISITRTNKEATRVLGINEQTFKALKRKYCIREEYDTDLE